MLLGIFEPPCGCASLEAEERLRGASREACLLQSGLRLAWVFKCLTGDLPLPSLKTCTLSLPPRWTCCSHQVQLATHNVHRACI